MKKEYLIIGGLALVGIYFLMRKKDDKVESKGYERDSLGMPLVTNQHTGLTVSYNNTANCEEQFKESERIKNMQKVMRKPMTSDEYKTYKQNWIKNNCRLKV